MKQKQIAEWSRVTYEQAEQYADLLDPERTRKNRIANKLDAIARLAREIYFELTGEILTAGKH